MTGLEPATSGVTGRRSNQLSYIRVTATSPRGASDMTRLESCQRPSANQRESAVHKIGICVVRAKSRAAAGSASVMWRTLFQR